MSYVGDKLPKLDSERFDGETEKALTTSFESKDLEDLGVCKEFLKVKLGTKPDGKSQLSQDKFVSDLLAEYDLQECKPVSTSLKPIMYQVMTKKLMLTENECKEWAGTSSQEAAELFLRKNSNPSKNTTKNESAK